MNIWKDYMLEWGTVDLLFREKRLQLSLDSCPVELEEEILKVQWVFVSRASSYLLACYPLKYTVSSVLARAHPETGNTVKVNGRVFPRRLKHQ